MHIFVFNDYVVFVFFVIFVLIATILITRGIRRKFPAASNIYQNSNPNNNRNNIILFLISVSALPMFYFNIKVTFIVFVVGFILYEIFRVTKGYNSSQNVKQYFPRIVWIFSSCILLAGTSFFLFQTFSLESIMDQHPTFTSGEIYKVNITGYKSSAGTSYGEIKDEQMIDELVNNLSKLDIQRKVTKKDGIPAYIVSFENYRGSFYMEVYEHYIKLGSKPVYYEVINSNGLYSILEEYELESIGLNTD